MADMNLTQAEADALLAVHKHRVNEDRSDFALATAAERMWGAALTLIILVLLLNLVGRAIAHYSSVKK